MFFIIFLCSFFLSSQVYSFENSEQKAEVKTKISSESTEADDGSGWYLALLNHAYFDVGSVTANDTLRAMITYIPGNDFYLTITPSMSWPYLYDGDASPGIQANDIYVTLSYGSLNGGSPASVFMSSTFTGALTLSVPVSSYSRSSGLITNAVFSVSSVNIFNQKRTSISFTPSFGYAFRQYSTSAPMGNIDESNSFYYDGYTFEKLIPYSHYSLGFDVTMVHRFFEMTYWIVWFSSFGMKSHEDAVLHNGENVIVTPSSWSKSFSFGQKLFFPLFDYLWGDIAVNSSGPMESFNPISTDDGNSITASIGLSYFF
jgi:hypothetical protein